MDGTERPAWKNYPYVLSADDPELTFPAAEGDQGAESNTFYLAARLCGRETRHEWAFLVVFTFNDIGKRLRADFYTLALFDLATGAYGTYSEYDLPRPLRWRRRYKLTVERGHLDVAFESACGRASWTTRRDASGALDPFSYRLSLCGRDDQGRSMRLELDADTFKPPMPVGGAEYAGVKTCMGQYGTHSYFQSEVRLAGTLEWGDVREEVDGDSGWIDRQWTPRHLGVHTDRKNTRYRHEWRQIHLDNGVEMSVWLHFDRHRGNRIIPFSGATAARPEGTVMATTELQVDRLTFVRDPGRVTPQYPLGRGAKYFADAYRLRIPAWQLDLFSEPLVPAPAHLFPIEYWSGPTRIRGIMGGRAVTGLGFNERTFVFLRDFELVEVLRESLRHLDPGLSGTDAPLTLANLVWEADGFLSHGDRRGALHHVRTRVRPHLERLDPSCRAHILRIADDLEASLGG